MKFIPKEIEGNVNVSKNNKMKEFLKLITGLVIFFISFYFIVSISLKLFVPFVPYSFEVKLGDFLIKNLKVMKKHNKKEKIQKICNELSNFIIDEEREYEILILDNKNSNALAYPGGKIVIFSGLLDEVESENEIAFVLAHELGHYYYKDHLNTIGRRLVLYTMFSIIFGSNSKLTNLIGDSISKIEMKLSQKNELRADMFALNLLKKRYGHVNGAIDFFRKIEKKEDKSYIDYYFLTHPHPKKRIDIIKKEINKKEFLLKEKIDF